MRHVEIKKEVGEKLDCTIRGAPWGVAVLWHFSPQPMATSSRRDVVQICVPVMGPFADRTEASNACRCSTLEKAIKNEGEKKPVGKTLQYLRICSGETLHRRCDRSKEVDSHRAERGGSSSTAGRRWAGRVARQAYRVAVATCCPTAQAIMARLRLS